MKTFFKRLLKINVFRLATLITIICIILYFLKPSFLELMELKVFDLRFISRGNKKPGNEVVIATIDEKSLDELGRWPWPRTIIARLVDKLHSCQVKTIGFDIVFPEPDECWDCVCTLTTK